jgi:protein-disulfide isomerase
MLRRFLVTTIRRSFLILLLICLGCAAQTAPPELARKIEHQVRTYYTIPADVKVTVGAIASSAEWPGYDTVAVAIDGGDGKPPKDYQFLLSKNRDTLLRVTKFDLRKDAYEDVMAKINIGDRPIRGTKGAKVVVVNFDDFECPYCSAMHRALFPEILKEYGDRVEFVYKDFPLSDMHPWALHASVDANCLAAQNADAYWDFADYIHANKREVDGEKTPGARLEAVDKTALLQGQKHNLDATKLQSCIKAQNEDAVRASMKEGDALGVNATPTLFINGQKIDGVVSPDELRAALDSALKDAGQPAPAHTPAAAAPASK